MKRTNIFGLITLLAVVGATLLVSPPRPQAQAQGGCTPFQALVQGSLPSPSPLVDGDTWGGEIYASLGGEFLAGILSGKEEATRHGTVGMGRGTTYKVCFDLVGDCTDSFTYEAQNAVWPVQPGKVGVGYYQANSAKIVQGTGRFQYAWGNLDVAGPFIVWRPEGGRPLGRWNADITGHVCGVE